MKNQPAHSDSQKFYARLATAVVRNQLDRVVDLVDEVPLSMVDATQSELVGKVVPSVGPSSWKTMLETAARNRRLAIQAMVVSAAVVVLAVLGIVAWKALPLIFAMPTPPPTVVPPRAPTFTFTFTPTTTPSPTPTSTPSQTSPPVSSYLVTNPASVVPAIPRTAQSFWVIPGASAEAQPPSPEKQTWSTEGADVPYTDNAGVTITWKMDQPLPVGVYALYYLDRKSHSNGSYQFNLASANQEIPPLDNTGMANLVAKGDQESDQWSFIGFYLFSQPHDIVISTATNSDMSNRYLNLDDVLILQLPTGESTVPQALPLGRPLAFFLDDANVKTLIQAASSGQYNPSSGGWEVVQQPDAWLGAMHVLSSWVVPVQVQFPAQPVKAGKYELLVWIPSNGATAKATYSMFLGGTLAPPDSPREITQSTQPGCWRSLGTWDLGVDGDLVVQIDATVDPTNSTQLGVDAIALVMVQ